MAMEKLPENLEPQILACVNDNEKRMKEDLILLKNWMACQPHLPHESYDDRVLQPFLRGCKHDIEKAKGKLDMYFTCRTIYPEIFQNRDPSEAAIQQALQIFNIVPLPKPTEDGYRLVMHRYSSADASLFDPRVVFKTIFMIADIRLAEEPPIIGDVFLFDVQHITAAHFTKIVTPLLKYALHSAQEAYPQRLKEIHIINAPPIMDRVITFFRSFLKEKMRNRFLVHKTVDSVWGHIPRTHLPEDYGGDLKTLEDLQNSWNSKLLSYKGYFERQETVKSDESKRLKPIKNDLSTFGVDGAFRQLEID